MIYLLEDDQSIRELVSYTLSSVGMETKGFSLPSEFFSSVKESIPELVLLDIMLPEEDGISVLKKLRGDKRTSAIPVMILSAKGTEFDRVVGLDTGADDYLPKPFGMMELIARTKALLRRSSTQKTDDVISVGILTVSDSAHRVTVNGNDVVLTLKEYELLNTLLNNRGNVLSRDKLLNIVWGYSFDGESRTVDVHVRTLRQKLGPAGEYIETVRGVGYRIS